MPRKNGKVIAISGGDSWVNLGDEAILSGTLKLIEDLDSNFSIKIISGNKKITKNQFPDYEVVDRNNLLQYFIALKEVDVFFWGGGHLIQNTSSKIFLIFQFVLLLIPIIQKKCMIGFSLGAEKINGKLWQLLTKWILSHFRLISVRDRFSENVLKELDLKVPIRLTSDPAVVLSAPLVINPKLISLKKRPYVVISPRKWFDYKSALIPIKWQRKIQKSGNLKYKKIIKLFAEICDWLVENFDYNICFIAMYMSNEQSDDFAGKLIRDSMEHQEKAFILDWRISPIEMIGFIKDAELLMGMRMHSTILGACAEIPIIGLYYQNKGKKFFESLNLEKCAVPIETFDLDEIKTIIKRINSDQESILSTMRNNMIRLRVLAKENMDFINKIINS